MGSVTGPVESDDSRSAYLVPLLVEGAYSPETPSGVLRCQGELHRVADASLRAMRKVHKLVLVEKVGRSRSRRQEYTELVL